MRTVLTCFLGCLLALAALSAVLVVLWPSLRTKLVADVNAEITRQNVVGGQTASAVRSLRAELGV